MDVSNLKISLMERSNIQASAEVLSLAMLNNPIHNAVYLGNGDHERLAIEKTFYQLFTDRPGIVFLAKDNQKILGVMRMRSCSGPKIIDEPVKSDDEHDVSWRKSVWHKEWASHDPVDLHWHLGPIGVLPSQQGIGVGTLLMQRFCEEVDMCSARAYLETDLDKNVSFYEKFGFAVISTSTIFNVASHYMLRAIQI